MFSNPLDAKAWFAPKSPLAVSRSQVRKHEGIRMLTGLQENGSLIRKFTDMLASYKKIIPTSGAEMLDAKLKRELERLALSAPHMLPDIGFERDLNACTEEKAVWRRGTHYVIISSSKHAAAFI